MSLLDDFLAGEPGPTPTSAPAGFKPVVTEQGRTRHPVDKIDPRLYQIMAVAASQSPYEVRFDSGYREGDKRQHGKHRALDVELWDKRTGKKLADYQDPAHFREYEQFAQTARAVQQQLYPELNQAFRWGGYFSGKKNYGALDLMHFDIGGGKGLGMLGGSWEGGLSDNQRRLWKGIVSEGMGPARGQGLQQAMGPRESNLRRDMRQYYGGSFLDDFLDGGAPAPAAKYNPQEIQDYIRKRSVETGLNPAMMLALAHRESGFDPTIKSKIKKNEYNKIGVGLYQFIPPTARQWGLSDEDRRDYRKSTDAAMRFMTHLKNRFGGDERLALAAWNAGEGSAKKGTGVRGALARGVDPDSITEGGHVAAVLNLMKRYETPEATTSAAPARTTSSRSLLDDFLES